LKEFGDNREALAHRMSVPIVKTKTRLPALIKRPEIFKLSMVKSTFKGRWMRVFRRGREEFTGKFDYISVLLISKRILSS
jgi:hypothetical protein